MSFRSKRGIDTLATSHPLTEAPQRRRFLATGALLTAAAASSACAQQPTAPAPATTPTSANIPLVAPRTEFVYEAIVDIDPPLQLGQSPFGERRMVPITGGTFEGPGLRGKVMPGGADRQLVRRDGATNLDAVYELQTHDGVIISIRNRVLTRPHKDGAAGRYAFSTIEITAPDGAYGWLNDFVYVGTLNSLRPQRQAVVIRVFKVV